MIVKKLLEKYPSKLSTRLLLITGLLIFIPVYTYMLTYFKSLGIDPQEYNGVLLSFDVDIFQAFIKEIATADHLDGFLRVFQLNIISITGFMTAFFALGLVIDRAIPADSRLNRFTFISSPLTILVAVLDMIASLVFLFAGENLVNIGQLQVNIVSSFYYGRVLLLYAVILWFIVAGITLLVKRVRT